MNIHKLFAATTLLGSLSAPLALAADVKVAKVTLKVKANNSWITTSGQLWKLNGNSRAHVAYIDEDGTPDVEISCSPGDRFEAAASSLFDAPVPPPRLTCRQALEFQFTRSVFAVSTPETVLVARAAAPLVYSELSSRSSEAGETVASAAFSDAAISSTAQLLGDDRLEKLVVRDPAQNYKLVFTAAGQEALKEKQKASGLRAYPQIVKLSSRAALGAALDRDLGETC